ncbi:hypothetical protein D3C74_352820 [compost metagenome]
MADIDGNIIFDQLLIKLAHRRIGLDSLDRPKNNRMMGDNQIAALCYCFIHDRVIDIKRYKNTGDLFLQRTKLQADVVPFLRQMFGGKLLHITDYSLSFGKHASTSTIWLICAAI